MRPDAPGLDHARPGVVERVVPRLDHDVLAGLHPERSRDQRLRESRRGRTVRGHRDAMGLLQDRLHLRPGGRPSARRRRTRSGPDSAPVANCRATSTRYAPPSRRAAANPPTGDVRGNFRAHPRSVAAVRTTSATRRPREKSSRSRRTVGSTPIARHARTSAWIFSGRWRRQRRPAARTPLKYRNGPPTASASSNVRLPVTIRTPAEANRRLQAPGSIGPSGTHSMAEPERTGRGRGDRTSTRRTPVPRRPRPMPSTSRSEDDGLAYQTHSPASTPSAPARELGTAGQIGPTWTASGNSRTNAGRGRNVWKRWSTFGRSNPRNVRNSRWNRSASLRNPAVRRRAAVASEVSPPSRHRSAFSSVDGSVRANSSRLTWSVAAGPYARSTASASTAQGPPRPRRPGRSGAALTPQFGATVSAR